MKQLKLSWLGLFAAFFITSIVFVACQKDAASPDVTSNAKRILPLDAPTLSCVSSTGASITLGVKAGASGASAGFSIQWMLKTEFDANGWPASSDIVGGSSFCKASFSGVPGCSGYNLGPDGYVEVTIGDLFDACGASGGCGDLKCGKDYVFRAFAHNEPGTGGRAKSAFSGNKICSTLACGGEGCTYTQGYWKTHGPIPTGNNQNEWDVTSLILGTVTYTDLELLSIMNTPAGGNGLISLAHQLIAAKLNVANGSSDADIAASIAAADALIGGLVIPPVGSGYLAPSVTSALNNALTNYNEGATGPGHCD